MLRRALDNHLSNECSERPTKCEFCDTEMPYRQIKRHGRLCLKQPTLCLCGLTFPRDELDEHVATDCPRAVIACPYRECGCTEKLERRDMPQHLLDLTESHAALSSQTLYSLRTRIVALENLTKELVFEVPLAAINFEGGSTSSKVSPLISGYKFHIDVSLKNDVLGCYLVHAGGSDHFPIHLSGTEFNVCDPLGLCVKSKTLDHHDDGHISGLWLSWGFDDLMELAEVDELLIEHGDDAVITFSINVKVDTLSTVTL
jgi:hypothetical protein